MDSIGEQENFGVGDVGKIGDEPFYRFPPKLREPWSASDSQEFGRDLSYMDWDDDKPSGGGGGDPGICVPDQDWICLSADILDGYEPDDYQAWHLLASRGPDFSGGGHHALWFG